MNPEQISQFSALRSPPCFPARSRQDHAGRRNAAAKFRLPGQRASEIHRRALRRFGDVAVSRGMSCCLVDVCFLCFLDRLRARAFVEIVGGIYLSNCRCLVCGVAVSLGYGGVRIQRQPYVHWSLNKCYHNPMC